MSSVFTPWLSIYPCVLAIRCLFLCMFQPEKKYLPWTNVIKCVLVSDYLNGCIDDMLFMSHVKEPYVTVITSWHWSLGGSFLSDIKRYLNWPALSSSWHLAASGKQGCWPHCITVTTSVFLSKEAIWRPPWVQGYKILGTFSVSPY